MKIMESAENYLEAILVLNKEKGIVRAIDIVNHLGFSKPSVSIAMKQLETNGFIERNPDGFITLTEDGQKIAESVYARHELLTRLFIELGVSEEVAAEDACRVEHYISEETFDALSAHFNNMKSDK